MQFVGNQSLWEIFQKQNNLSPVQLVARWSHLSGRFWLFAPKFWEVAGTYEL